METADDLNKKLTESMKEWKFEDFNHYANMFLALSNIPLKKRISLPSIFKDWNVLLDTEKQIRFKKFQEGLKEL